MLKIKRLKYLAIFLIVLCACILPTAFSVSYAKWQGGSADIKAGVSVGEWGSSFVPDAPVTGFDLPANGGVVAIGSDGKPYKPVLQTEGDNASDAYYPHASGLSGEGFIYDENGNKYVSSVPLTIQIFAVIDGKAQAVNYAVTQDGIAVGHEDGSYWYTLPDASKYYKIWINPVDKTVTVIAMNY